MPPKAKITKKDIIEAAIELIRANGVGSINARSVAASLGCSTQTVFSNFATMEDLEEAIIKAAYDRYFTFLKNEAESRRYPPYKSFGMAYIRFARDEKELFKLLFMCDRSEKELTPTQDFEASIQMIMNANGLSEERARLMHLEMWTCVHGIGTMLATSFLSLEWELIENILTDVYQGIRTKQLSEVNQNVCDKT